MNQPTGNSPGTALTIRHATVDDCPLILQFILELAEYERLSHAAVVTEADLRENLFGDEPCAEVLIAEAAGEPAGFALYFQSFSTFLGRPGIYLEDLFVRPQFRGRGIGRELLRRLAATAIERRCGRMEWVVLDWNRPAIDFYDTLGAEQMKDWIVTRLTGESLSRLAAARQDGPRDQGAEEPK